MESGIWDRSLVGNLTLAECGDATILARAKDPAGNVAMVSMTVSRVCPASLGSNSIFIASMWAVGVAVAIAAWLLMRRRG